MQTWSLRHQAHGRPSVGFSIVQEIPGFPPTNSLFDAMNDAVASPRSLAIIAPAMPIIAC
jgi:hypothetical protein